MFSEVGKIILRVNSTVNVDYSIKKQISQPRNLSHK